MSMLSHQADELRTQAHRLDSARDFMEAANWFTPESWLRDSMEKCIVEMREAADTIISLRNRLQESERHNRINLEVMGEMYHPEIVELTQECHATRANYEHCKYSANRGWRDTSRYSELFGTPERAARTITRMQMGTDLMGCCDADMCPAAFDECWKLDSCPMDDYDALLEWLEGDAV